MLGQVPHLLHGRASGAADNISSDQIIIRRRFDSGAPHAYILVELTRNEGRMMATTSRKSSRRTLGPGRWRLQDAKARFSELVRHAQQKGRQRVTVHGKDAVVVVDANEWDRLKNPISGRDLVDALAHSPLGDVPFERVSVKIRARDVDL
jgi:prevent-host-death family protein